MRRFGFYKIVTIIISYIYTTNIRASYHKKLALTKFYKFFLVQNLSKTLSILLPFILYSFCERFCGNTASVIFLLLNLFTSFTLSLSFTRFPRYTSSTSLQKNTSSYACVSQYFLYLQIIFLFHNLYHNRPNL